MLNDRPFTADHRTEKILPAATIFLEVATSHHHHLVVFIFIGLIAMKIKAIDLRIPEFKEPAKEPFWLSDHDIVAAVTSLFALARLLIRRADEKARQLLHREIEMEKGEKEVPHRPSDPSGHPLARNPSLRKGWGGIGFSRFKYKIF